MNRNLWGVENFEEVKIRHSKFAANRFAHEAAPALERFSDSSPMRFVSGVKTARERIVARKDADREDFLRKRGFSKAESAKIVATVLGEERSEEHTSELQSLMRNSYAVFCLKHKNETIMIQSSK